MRIGIIGSGTVGQALARGLARHGHQVRIGTRGTDRPELADLEPGPTEEVAGWAELVYLSVNGEIAAELAGSLAAAIGSKVLVDTTNPLDFSGGGPGIFVGTTDSLGERVQRALPEASVVKAYNIVGNALMVDPDLPGGPPTMLIAGDHETAKQTVSDILVSTGWEVADLGDITASRWLEAVAMAWVCYGIRAGSWTHAFKLLRSQ
jgi:predicted dinucleotide-binding enzyme